jgi:hypothetical protein
MLMASGQRATNITRGERVLFGNLGLKEIQIHSARVGRKRIHLCPEVAAVCASQERVNEK